MVSYYYDSWGKPTSTTGTLKASLGALNPFRYRGYIYDEETGFYYLNSRYYDPETGRFINADDVSYLGVEGPYKTVYSKIVIINGFEVEVVYAKLIDCIIKISDAWVNP